MPAAALQPEDGAPGEAAAAHHQQHQQHQPATAHSSHQHLTWTVSLSREQNSSATWIIVLQYQCYTYVYVSKCSKYLIPEEVCVLSTLKTIVIDIMMKSSSAQWKFRETLNKADNNQSVNCKYCGFTGRMCLLCILNYRHLYTWRFKVNIVTVFPQR